MNRTRRDGGEFEKDRPSPDDDRVSERVVLPPQARPDGGSDLLGEFARTTGPQMSDIAKIHWQGGVRGYVDVGSLPAARPRA